MVSARDREWVDDALPETKGRSAGQIEPIWKEPA
jgi:hypothetical protein